jgi:hypothetical protein
VSEATLSSQAAAETQLVRGRHHADGSASDEGDVGEVRKWRAQGDDLLDALGPALRQHLRQQTAAAVSDERDRRVVVLLDLGHSVAEAGEHSLRMKDVEVDARKVRVVADPLQPTVHQAHRPIAREEAWNQEHCATVAARNATPAKDRVLPKSVQLAQGERIPEPHVLGW